MKAVVIRKHFPSIQDIRVSEEPDPVLDYESEVDNVIIDIIYASANFVDILYVAGKHQNNKFLKPPFILGLEASGIVTAAKPNSRFKKGDRVFGAFQGAFATKALVPASALRHLPPPNALVKWSLADVAGISSTFVTSYGGLDLAKLKPGESILVHAGAGGLGLTAIMFAKAMGASCIIATASSSKKLDVARHYGADFCVNYVTNPKWEDEVNRLTNGKGVNVVFDPVGLVKQSIRCTAYNGRVLVIGFAGRTNETLEDLPVNRVLLKQIHLLGWRAGENGRNFPWEKLRLEHETWNWVASGKIKPINYETVFEGLESVPRALQAIQSRESWGKVIVHVQKQAQL